MCKFGKIWSMLKGSKWGRKTSWEKNKNSRNKNSSLPFKELLYSEQHFSLGSDLMSVTTRGDVPAHYWSQFLFLPPKEHFTEEKEVWFWLKHLACKFFSFCPFQISFLNRHCLTVVINWVNSFICLEELKSRSSNEWPFYWTKIIHNLENNSEVKERLLKLYTNWDLKDDKSVFLMVLCGLRTAHNLQIELQRRLHQKTQHYYTRFLGK